MALRTVLDRPDGSWAELLDLAPIDVERRRLLLIEEQASLDLLAAELNECRGLGEHPAHTPVSPRADDAGSVPPTDTPIH